MVEYEEKKNPPERAFGRFTLSRGALFAGIIYIMYMYLE